MAGEFGPFVFAHNSGWLPPTVTYNRPARPSRSRKFHKSYSRSNPGRATYIAPCPAIAFQARGHSRWSKMSDDLILPRQTRMACREDKTGNSTERLPLRVG